MRITIVIQRLVLRTLPSRGASLFVLAAATCLVSADAVHGLAPVREPPRHAAWPLTATRTCLPEDVEALRRLVARARATGMALLSTVSDELVATRMMPAAAPLGRGEMDGDNPLIRAYHDQLSEALGPAAGYITDFEACFTAGTLPSEAMLARVYLLAGATRLMIAESFEDFIIEAADGPVGPLSMHVFYEEAINHFHNALAHAESAGEQDLAWGSRALEAVALFGHAVWDDRKSGITTPSLLAVPAAMSVAAIVTGQAPVGWEFGIPVRFDLWPDLIPSLGYADIDAVGSLVAQVDDPETAQAAPSLQSRLDDWFVEIQELKSLPLVGLAEMYLIVAEGYLALDDVVLATSWINQLRAELGLPAAAPADFSEALELLEHHRRVDLFLQGRRLADQYRFGSTTPEWSSAPTGLLPVPSEVGLTTVDYVAVPDRVGPLPSIALVDGRAPWGCLNDEALHLFRGETETLLGGPLNIVLPDRCRSEVAVFSHRNRMLLQPVSTWTAATGDDETLTLDERYELPIHVYGPASGEDQAKMDVAMANSIFAMNRVGIRLSMTYDGATALVTKSCWCPGDTPAAAPPSSCDWSPTNGFPAPTTAGLLNVYYLPKTADGRNDADALKEIWGYSCPSGPGQPEPMLFVSTEESSATTLAHEIGHLLIKPDPVSPYTHTYPTLSGFDATNLMASSVDISLADARDHLTLGQAFKANVDDRSWLNLSLVRNEPTATRRCQCDVRGTSPCPALSFDLAEVAGWTESVGGGRAECRDFVDHDPTPWAAPDPLDWAVILFDADYVPGSCVDDQLEPLRYNPIESRFYFLLPNLDDPEGCPSSEFFVFSRYFEMQHGSFTNAQFTSGPGDQLDLTGLGLPAGLRNVDVEYWLVSGALADEAVPAHATLEAAFADNRLGVSIPAPPNPFPGPQIIAAPAPPCNPTAPGQFTTGKLNVYLSPTLPAGAPTGAMGHVCGGNNNVVYVRSGPTTTESAPATELAHQVGHAFGLADVSEGDLPPGAIDVNLMRSATDGDPATRVSLTIGQLFRAYWSASSWLHSLVNPGPSRCGAGDTTCPYLGTNLPGG